MKRTETIPTNRGARLRCLKFALTIIVGVMLTSVAHAQTTMVWNSFGSGTSILVQNKIGVTSILGQPFAGAPSGGGISLSSGFGAYVLGKGALSGISNSRNGIPLTYSLSQNYPNPFNPSTVIEYGLPSRSRVRLQVFSILGQLVATLYEGEQSAGYQRVQWNAPVSTGVYIYTIDATSIDHPDKRFVQVKKMMLLK